MVVLETLISVLIVSLVSLGGIFFLSMKEKTLQKLLIYIVSFAVGGIMGNVFFHLLPELVEAYGFELSIATWIVVGIVISFVIEKFIHWHHCHHPSHVAHTTHRGKAPVAYMSLVGDACHNIVDGIAIAASYLISIPTGIATTVAIVIHEFPQELGDIAILLHGGFSRMKALMLNLLTAFTAFIGAGIVLVLSSHVENIEAILLPITIGNFLYIAGTDLMPELHHETNEWKSFGQLIAFILGALLLYLATFLEA